MTLTSPYLLGDRLQALCEHPNIDSISKAVSSTDAAET